jgi:tRNA pseudouridine38-40 synthase
LLPDTVTRWLVRFGYDGIAFAGWARQPRLRTIEGEIRRGIGRFRINPAGEVAALEVASRTDRGVSARANALVLESSLPAASLLRALNGIAPDIFFTGAVAAPPGFRVRKAVRRVYRYFDPTPVRVEARRAAAVRLFSGSIDVRSFGRGIPAGSPTWRTVDSVASWAENGGTVLEVRAPSFVWGMVRKIVTALRQVDEGRLTPAHLAAAVNGRSRLSLPLAEPEPLLLWEVEYPFKWEFEWTGYNRHQSRHLRIERDRVWARRQLVAELAP